MLIKRFGSAGLLALALLVFAPIAVGPDVAVAQDAEAKEDSKALDVIILNSGRVIEGRVIGETDTQVEVMVNVAGIEAPVTYDRADILKIDRGGGAEVESGDEDATRSGRKSTVSETRKSERAGESTVYLLEMEGRLIGENGLDAFPRRTTITASSIEDALSDAMSFNPEVIVVKLDVEAADGRGGVYVAEYISPVFKELIYDQNQRVVFWVKRAIGGAGLLPFISPEIYFTGDGTMGGFSGIGETASGDEMVDEKLIGAALGAAEGLAIRGGYESGPQLIRAMARKEQWLAVRWRGGEPQFIDWEPRPEIDGDDWMILTDDGQGENKDDSVIGGNDILNLDATLAERLRVSKGTYDLLDDLIYDLDIGRDYEVVEGKGERILEDYGERVARAFDDIRELRRDLEDLGNDKTRRGIGRQIRVLEQIRGLLASYSEALDPTGAQRSQINVQIEALRQAIANSSDRRERRGPRGPGRNPF